MYILQLFRSRKQGLSAARPRGLCAGATRFAKNAFGLSMRNVNVLISGTNVGVFRERSKFFFVTRDA